MTKIKICGLRRREDVELVNRYRPDYAGFVFAPGKRQISLSWARILAEELLPDIQKVGVFVNAPAEEILAACREGIIDLIQLHGEEGEDMIRYLKEKTGKSVIRALRIRTKGQVRSARYLPSDYLLFDAYQKGIPGGTGRELDLALISGVDAPFFLAGGLSPDNVREKIAACHPYCVDVSSGVEAQGYKEENRVRQFIDNVRKEDLAVLRTR